ncbi:LmbE-like protein [Meredithblackwellia eburnea MCA 4105]
MFIHQLDYGLLTSSLLSPCSKALRTSRFPLWVIAHPDDESFFFAPSILSLVADPSRKGSILCLSVGNHKGVGQIRARELKAACGVLGVTEDRCVSLDLPELPDDPNVWWTTEAVRSNVAKFAQRWEADAIISFDNYGVSGHANHRALAVALQSKDDLTPFLPATFEVKSTSLLFKYTSILGLPFELFLRQIGSQPSPSSLFFNSPRQYLRTRRAFSKHESQWRWFRTLFVSFSRYLWWVEVQGPL